VLRGAKGAKGATYTEAGGAARQDCDESRPQGGQAPDQANSGHQAGAAALTRTDHSEGTQNGRSLRRVTCGTATPGWQRSQTDRPAEPHSPLRGCWLQVLRTRLQEPGFAVIAQSVTKTAPR
jgi:hypothetical protein